jgi:hypothetical protein
MGTDLYGLSGTHSIDLDRFLIFRCSTKSGYVLRISFLSVSLLINSFPQMLWSVLYFLWYSIATPNVHTFGPTFTVLERKIMTLVQFCTTKIKFYTTYPTRENPIFTLEIITKDNISNQFLWYLFKPVIPNLSLCSWGKQKHCCGGTRSRHGVMFYFLMICIMI